MGKRDRLAREQIRFKRFLEIRRFLTKMLGFVVASRYHSLEQRLRRLDVTDSVAHKNNTLMVTTSVTSVPCFLGILPLRTSTLKGSSMRRSTRTTTNQ